MGSLVSIIVATYNSSRFIEETLVSISKQTWNELELIITDDCSEDDTVEVCRNWLGNNDNKERFKHTEIITSEKNTGVSANANRGLRAATGEWIKFLAADDTLKPDSVKDNMEYITSRPEIKVLLSCIEIYRETFEPQNLLKKTPEDAYNQNSIVAPDRCADSQYRMLLLDDRIHYSPSMFIHRETIIKVGAFDERFRLLEDYPLWLNLTRNGYKLYFMDKTTVNYRSHAKAINNTGFNFLVNPNYFKQREVKKVYTYPYLPTDVKLNQQFTWYSSQIFRWEFLNKNKTPNRFLYFLLTVFLNPFKYYLWIRKKLNKNLNSNEFYS